MRRTSRELLIAAGGLVAAFVALTLYVRFVGRIPGDAFGIDWARDHAARGQTVGEIYLFFGSLGTPAVALATTLAAAAVVWRNVSPAAAVFVPAGALIALSERSLADLIGTTDASLEVLFPAGGYPSGHALYGMGLFGALAILGGRHHRPEVVAIMVALIFGMGFVRVASGSHLLDEVLGSYLLGGAWLCALLAFSRRVL